ncbi:asparagine synthase (glutamine-hydrolysing) [Sphingomonas laterariae]|uniref:Asparagine synthase (Glutamine-hydrolysing) n=1 Tax=Edaphosphingomonas laterariae TaxID=861865 RepID=A0A239I2H8_9SPHN|nr:asparagine synthase-related protein [Sphingomonas laterariae]SNS88056.1 asparagine synthase (glutamine-hydrolysing) [Sphingomonas laterariae]
MSDQRFIALFPGADGIADHMREALLEKANAIGLETRHIAGVQLVAAPSLSPVPVGTEGLILGKLYRRADAHRLTSLSTAEAHTIIASEGQSLLRDHWGSYCAILHCGGHWRTVRDPTAGHVCYRIATSKIRAIASDPALARDLGLITGHIDWSRVVHGLIFRDLMIERTRIHGCHELFPGSVTDLDGVAASIWRPQDFLACPPPDLAVLSRTTASCVAALAAGHDHILLELSGGLDSSLLALALDEAGARFSCATLATRAGDGDERHYARHVANTLGRQLVELPHRSELAHPGRCPAPHLPGPVVRAFAQSSDQLLAEAAEAIGADAFMSGGGGDNIFCNMNSATPATDRLLQTRSPLGFARTLLDLAGAHEVNIWAALRPAWHHLTGWRHDRTWPRDDSLLHPTAIARFPMAEAHPWVADPGDILPGKRRHVEAILAILNHVGGFPRGQLRPIHFPLLAQPMVEACLAMPSWRFFEGGVDRVPERRLLANRLPTIAARRSKGGVAAMAGAIFRQHRPLLRSLVLEGELARQRLIDRKQAETLLRDDALIVGDQFYRLLAFAEIEAWAKHWR